MKRRVLSVALALSMLPYFAFAGPNGPVELEKRIDPWDVQENVTNNNNSNKNKKGKSSSSSSNSGGSLSGTLSSSDEFMMMMMVLFSMLGGLSGDPDLQDINPDAIKKVEKIIPKEASEDFKNFLGMGSAMGFIDINELSKFKNDLSKVRDENDIEAFVKKHPTVITKKYRAEVLEALSDDPGSSKSSHDTSEYYNPDNANMAPDGGGIYDTTDPDDNPFDIVKPKKKKPQNNNSENNNTADANNSTGVNNNEEMLHAEDSDNENVFDYNFDYKIEDNSGLSDSSSSGTDSSSGFMDFSLNVGGDSNVSSDDLIDYGFGLNSESEKERPKKISFQFVLNKDKPTEQLIDTGIDSKTTDRRDLTELLRQISVITKSEYVQDEKEVLLLSNGVVKTFSVDNKKLIEKDIPYSDVLSFFNSKDFEVKENLTRTGEKFLMVESFEKNKNIKVLVDGKEIKLTTPAKKENGIVFLPIRDIATAMGATINWNEKTYEANITKDNKSIQYKGSSDIAIKTQDNKNFKYHLEEKAEITKEKRLLAGISILVKTFDYDMYWDSWKQALRIESKEYKKEQERLEALESAQRGNANLVGVDKTEDKKETTPAEQPQTTTSEKAPEKTSNNPAETTNEVDNEVSNQDKIENESGEDSEEDNLDEEIKRPEKKKPSKKDRKKKKKDKKQGKTREKKKGIFSFRFGRKK